MKNVIAFKNKTLKHLASGTLPQSGQKFEIIELTRQQIPEIMALQSKIINALKPAEKSFVLPKDQAFFENHFNNKNDMLGVLVDGKLIAQSILLYPSHAQPKTGMVDMEPVSSPDKTSVMQGVLVDSDFRGNNLMQLMIDHWIDHAQNKGRTHLLAEIETHNTASWASFMKAGLNLHSIGKDPEDDAVLYNAHISKKELPAKKDNLAGLFNVAANKAESIKTCKVENLNKQKQLFKKGYVCVAFAKHCQKLTFVEGKTYQEWQDKHVKQAQTHKMAVKSAIYR